MRSDSKTKFTSGSRNRIRMIFYKIGCERGRANEEKIGQAFSTMDDVPEWFLSIKKAPWDLDRRGVDYIIKTRDVGDLYIQVKSSKIGKRKFEQRRRRRRIAVVVINSADADEEVRARVVLSAEALRELYLLKRAALLKD